MAETGGQDHCWHETGEHTLAHPRRRRQQCCHCGVLREVHTEFGSRSGHGAHCPPLTRTVEIHGPAGDCPARSAGESEVA